MTAVCSLGSVILNAVDARHLVLLPASNVSRTLHATLMVSVHAIQTGQVPAALSSQVTATPIARAAMGQTIRTAWIAFLMHPLTTTGLLWFVIVIRTGLELAVMNTSDCVIRNVIQITLAMAQIQMTASCAIPTPTKMH